MKIKQRIDKEYVCKLCMLTLRIGRLDYNSVTKEIEVV